MKQAILSFLTLTFLFASSIFSVEHELDRGSLSPSAKIYYHNQFGDAVVDRQLFIANITVTYAIKPGLFVGGNFHSYVNSKEDDDWWAGPMITYYFNSEKRMNQFNQLFPFVDAYYVFGNESNLKRSMLGMQAGLLIFVSERVGIDFLVTFEQVIYHEDSFGDMNIGYQVFTGIGFSTYIF